MGTTILFPGDTDANEIPVFLNFHWGDYSKYNSDRTTDKIIGKGNVISVPYPSKFNVMNDVPYTNSASVSGGPLDNLRMAFDNITFNLEKGLNYFFGGGSSFTYDNMESVLTPGARRVYDVTIDLVAKSLIQSTNTKTIVDTFQKNAFSSWSGGNRLLWKHPPLWVITASTTASGSGTAPGWDPVGLPCVLRKVQINRNPVLDIPFNLPNNHPLAVRLDLTFVELEPAVNTTAGLKNRAWTFT